MNRFAICASVAIAMPVPSPVQAYEPPVRGNDLAAGERFMTFLHAQAVPREQGKDISDNSEWQTVTSHRGGVV